MSPCASGFLQCSGHLRLLRLLSSSQAISCLADVIGSRTPRPLDMERTADALLGFFALDFAVQWTAFLVSAFFQTEVFFDLLGSSTFVLGACASLALGGGFHERQVMATTLVSVWAVRLGTFLFMRILQTGRDSRFDGVRNVPPMLFGYWTIQGVWVFAVLLPVVALNASPKAGPWMQPTDILGLGLWAFGFLFETVADYQKYFFRLDDANKDKWISTGLWSLCRHPNYFGEMVLWWGMYLLCFAGLHSPTTKALGLVSPVFTMWSLLYLSGVPLIERAGDRRWGAQAEYLKYIEETPCIIPRWTRRRSLPNPSLEKKSS